MYWLEIVVVSVTLLLVWIWRWVRDEPDNFPPGPRGLPLVGYAPFLGKVAHRTLSDLGAKYGSIYSMKLGSRWTVVLNDWKAIQEALVKQSENFAGRPHTYIFDQIRGRNDIVSADGPTWKRNRQFTKDALGTLGYGKQSMEGIVMEEVRRLLDHLNSKPIKKVQINHLFYVPFFNIIWGLLGGKKVEVTDSEFSNEFSGIVNTILKEASHTNIIHFLPFLKRYHPWIRRRYLNYIKVHKKLQAFLNEIIDGHLETYTEGRQRDFIDVFLAEMFRRQNENKDTDTFHRGGLQGILYNMNNGGIDNGNNTLAWGLMYMVTMPEIQANVHRELDEVVGRERLPAFADSDLLPYTQAVLLEIQRDANVIPLSFPHCPMKTTQVLGYTIPKGTFVFENLWAVHHDPKYWGDPEVFRPERFLSPDGHVVTPEYLIPFSIGRRICMGASLAKMELFLLFAGIMHQYRFFCSPGEKLNFEPIVGLTSRPPTTSLCYEKR